MASRKKPNVKKGSKKKHNAKYGKKAGRGGKDDEDSVDSDGNLREFIDYGSDSTESAESTETSGESDVYLRSRPRRKAAIHARKKIKNCIKEDTPPKPIKNRIVTPKPSLRMLPSKRRCPSKRQKTSSKRPFRLVREKIKNGGEHSDTSDTASTEDTSSDTDESIEDYFEKGIQEKVPALFFKNAVDASDSSDASYTMDAVDTVDAVDSDEDEYPKGVSGILFALGGGGGSHSNSSMVPKKHNLKKESEDVKKFVKLLTDPPEENTIDMQITQFKALDLEKQQDLLYALEHRPVANDTGIHLMLKILTLRVSHEVKGMILSKYNSLQNLETSSGEYHKLRNWLDKAVSIPFGIYKDVPVRLEDGSATCGEFLKGAKKCLDNAAYGQEESKLQIMQFISTKIANPSGRGLSLLFIGPPGVGKTTLIKNGIAKALDWPFQFISLGGDSDASTYNGHQLVYESSHCGKIVNSLIASKSMSTVMMFDEVDKISQTPKGEEVMNLLIHLTDPVQNTDFEDKYLSGIPIDVSKVMFVFSANDITKIDRVLLDRMMVVNLQGYDLKQKSIIAEQYLLPAALTDVNMTGMIVIPKEVLSCMIREYASDDKGIRELKRCIEQIVQKINMLRMYNSPDLPFHIKDFSLPFTVKMEHMKLFLKKQHNPNAMPPGWYI